MVPIWGPHLGARLGPFLSRYSSQLFCYYHMRLRSPAGTGPLPGPRLKTAKSFGLADLRSETGLRICAGRLGCLEDAGTGTQAGPRWLGSKKCAAPWRETERGSAPAQDALGSSRRGDAIPAGPRWLASKTNILCFATVSGETRLREFLDDSGTGSAASPLRPAGKKSNSCFAVSEMRD